MEPKWNQNGTKMEPKWNRPRTNSYESIFDVTPGNLPDDPINVREHEATNEFLSDFEHLQLENDDEIELELVDQLEIAK